MTPHVTLRPVTEADFPTLYAHQQEPEANRLAAFPPRPWEIFEKHWKRILADTSLVARAICADGEVAGQIGVFGPPDEREVGYWLGSAWWGRGIGSRAVALCLEEVKDRPLHAHVAQRNPASRRVLEKCGFKVVGTERGALIEGSEVVDQWIMRLGSHEGKGRSTPTPEATR
jgi:RimJ/RimL family protein N-acetyltransferase